MKNDCPSTRDQTQQQPNVVGQGQEMGELNETAAGHQKKETLNLIPQTPIENQVLNTGKSSLTWDGQKGSENAKRGTKKQNLSRFKSSHQEAKDMGNRQKRVKE